MERAAINRLQWRCTRRALLELDLILGKFLAEDFPALDEAGQRTFVELADLEDHDLWPLVNGTEIASSARQEEILAMLRKKEVKNHQA